jgi:hypothetical protein
LGKLKEEDGREEIRKRGKEMEELLFIRKI